MTVTLAPPSRLWTRNFTLYFTARTMAVLGDTMLPVATAVAMYALGFSVTEVGVTLGVWMGAFALFVVFGGVLADRFHPRPQMIVADGLRFLVQGALAVFLWLGHAPLWLLLTGSLLGGLATAMFQPGLTSLVPQVSDDPQKANGVSRVSQGLATLAGPAMAGTLVAVVSPASVFAVNAFTFVVSGLCLAALRLPHFTPDRTASTLQNLVAGWVEFRSRSWLWSVILIWWVLGVFVWGPITPVGAASVIEAHGKAAFGWVESAFGAGCVLGGLVALRIRPVRPLYAGGIAMCLFPLMPLAAGLVPSVPVMMLGYGLSGIGWAYWGVQWATAVQTQIPQDKLNRVAAYEIAGSILAVPFGQAVAGPASSLVGVHELLVLGAVISLGCALALLAVRPVRQLALDKQP